GRYGTGSARAPPPPTPPPPERGGGSTRSWPRALTSTPGTRRPSRRLRQRLLALGESPIEPQRERLDVGALDGRATPDAQARRRVAVTIDVEGDALLLKRRSDAFDERRLRFGGKLCHRGIDDPQAHRGV